MIRKGLIVESERGMNESFPDILKDFGFEVEYRRDLYASAALKAIEDGDYDFVVFMDVLNYHELGPSAYFDERLRHVREFNANVEIIKLVHCKVPKIVLFYNDRVSNEEVSEVEGMHNVKAISFPVSDCSKMVKDVVSFLKS